MSRNKSGAFKNYLIKKRKKVKPGLTGSPVWVMQKTGERFWNNRQKRNWRRTEFGLEYKENKKK